MKIRVHSLLECSRVNGPGKRAAIWLQGCSLGCSACWNPETHPRKAGTLRTVSELCQWVGAASARSQIEGIMLSGGEPMEQAPALFELIEQIRTAMPHFSNGLFSGYTERELDQGQFLCFPDKGAIEKRALWRQIRSHLDFAVLGRYNRHLPTPDPLTTSRNQRLRLFSSRYTTSDFAPQTIEVTIDGSGLTQITGFPVLGPISQK